MGNIIVAIKRFFQNRNTVTILAILASVGIIYFAYNYRIKKSTQPVNVPYAVKEIGPRTLITNDMVAVKKIPGGVVTKDVATATNEIVGKYVINTAVIPEGGLFYRSMLVTWDDLPKGPFDDIGDDETIYPLPVSVESTYGNSIYPGNYIDIYYRLTDPETGKIWIGKFIESIRVLDVVDQYNNSVFETNGTPRKPSKLYFNVTTEMWELFRYINMVGGIELFPVQRNAEYSKSPSEMKITGNELKKYVENQVLDRNIISGGK